MCLCADRAEDGPTCIVIRPLDEDTRKSHFTWLLNMDVKVNPYALCSPSCRGIIVKDLHAPFCTRLKLILHKRECDADAFSITAHC